MMLDAFHYTFGSTPQRVTAEKNLIGKKACLIKLPTASRQIITYQVDNTLDVEKYELCPAT